MTIEASGVTGDVIRQVAERAAAGVVRVGRDQGRGAGFVLAPGRVATNAHNLRSADLTITFSDGRRAMGRAVGVDPDGDLAVVEVDTADLAPLGWSDGDSEVALGTPVVTVTSDAMAGTRVTAGRVSAVGAAFRGPRGRLVTDAVEHTAPLARGSSGGPLLDLDGRLLGINTHRREDGFYLAIPAGNDLRRRLDELAAGSATGGVRLGVAVAPPEVAARLRGAVGLPEREGLLVAGVHEGGPADRAGIRRGDLLTAIDGHALRSSEDLYEALDHLSPGATATLSVARATDDLEFTVRFDGDGAPPADGRGGAARS